jgi:hypothetical protein
METTLEQLAEAMENTRGKTPAEVVDAFCPKGASVAGLPLVPLTAGHDLFLSRVNHPLSRNAGGTWTPHDVAIALFAFTRPSRELFAMVEDETWDQALFAFLDTIPMGEIEAAAAALVTHWIRARATMVPMSSPHQAAGSKKKRASGGSYR